MKLAVSHTPQPGITRELSLSRCEKYGVWRVLIGSHDKSLHLLIKAGSQSDASTSIVLHSVALLRITSIENVLFELARYASVSLRQPTT